MEQYRTGAHIVGGNEAGCPDLELSRIFDAGGTYAEQFEARAPRASRAVAAEYDGQKLSYAELNARSNQLAHSLQARGIGPEDLVAVCLERSLDLLIALLSIWKAGAAYLPLDPDYPKERLDLMVSDSKAAWAITQRNLLSNFSGQPLKALCRDDLLRPERQRQYPTVRPATRATLDNLAYVIYTSGSTGRPKGVEVTQRSLLNHNLAIASAYQLRPGDRVLQFAPFSFDVFLEEIFPSWLRGCTVILRSTEVIASIPAFLEFVAREHLSVLNLPTAFWHELVAYLPQGGLPPAVRLIVIGGERASEEAYRNWKRLAPASVKLINAYGPTEATITSTCYEADRRRDTLPIGRPIANTHAVVLDEHLQPVAGNGTGELYIGGVGLARGYRNRPALTTERFIRNPCPAEIPSGRLYRTGDLARYDSEGNLEFVGRVDHQIKVRGYRIEPAEVETALLEYPEVKQAVVVARKDAPGHKRLAAYCVPRRSCAPSPNELSSFLKDRLPAYMVPSVFVLLEVLPRTPAGKLDRSALPPPPSSLAPPHPLVPPRTGIEQRLQQLWQQVLHASRVGIRQNFFDLGGDSLLAIQLLSRVREQFSADLPLSTLFEGQTIENMATALASKAALPDPPDRLRPDAPEGDRPASFIQEQLWFLHELDPQSDAYHIPLAFNLKGRLDIRALENALDQVVARHEVLRTAFRYSEGKLVQAVAPRLHLPLSLFKAGRSALQPLLQAEIRRPFDLSQGPLFRATLVRLHERDHVLLLVMHHSISDGWSLSILLDELQQYYNALASGSPAPALPQLSWQYADYARWQRRVMQGPQLEEQLTYWRQKLAAAPEQIQLPADRAEAAASEARADRCFLELPARTVKAAKAFAQRHRATPFMLLLGALGMALRKWTGQTDLVIGTVVAGRNRREFENLIGCFMNFLPLRLRLPETQSPGEILRDVKSVVLDAQMHQDCPFERIVAATNPKRTGTRNPLYNVGLLWHNYPERMDFSRTALRATRIPVWGQRALLDLRFEAEPAGKAWMLACEYDTRLFTRQTVAGLLSSFSRCFKLVIQTPLTHSPDGNCSGPHRPRWLNRLWRPGRAVRLPK